MKILFLNPPILNTIRSCMPLSLEQGLDFLPPLGLMYLAGYLEQFSEHKIEILDCPVEGINSYSQLKDKIREKNPEIVGITAMSFTIVDVIKSAKIIKEVNRQTKIVLGGPHVNIFPQETMKIKEVDFLVLGEGEKPFKDLLDNINNIQGLYKIKGIVFRDKERVVNTGIRELIMDLDKIPFPARHLTPYRKYFSVISKRAPVTTMFTSRGCPYKCLFCDRPHLGKIFRARTAINVVDEMDVCQNMGIKEIFIYDDTFGVDRQRVLNICSEIKRRGLNITWDVRTRVDTVDEEVLRAMKGAGCLRIHYGVEAGTKKILKVLRKGITLEQVRKAFYLTKKIGIKTLGYFMIGSPSETKEDILETIKLMKELNPDFVHVSITTPFPATDLYRLGLEKGLYKDYWRESAENPTPEFIPPPWEEIFSREEIFSLLKEAYWSFYLRPSYILRTFFRLRSFPEFGRKLKAALNIIKF